MPQRPATFGRSTPYTEKGIVRMRCYRCSRTAKFQWSACSLGWVPLCAECDIELNELVLAWAGVPGREELLAAYARFVRGER